MSKVWQRLHGAMENHHKACGRPAPGWTTWKPWDWCAENKHVYEQRIKYVAWAGDVPAGFLNVWDDVGSVYSVGKRLLYIEHVAAAPGNVATEIWGKRFEAVGSALFAFTALLSCQRGHEGRIGLHAADESALEFYRRLDAKCAGRMLYSEGKGIAGPTPRGELDRDKTYLETREEGARGWLENYLG